jgi:L-histidine Nalpha-methyltransferase
MSNRTSARRDACHDGANADFLNDLRDGLNQTQKRIPSRYFYDARGSALFEEITRLPEYYPTETEIRILQDNVSQLHETTPAGTCLVEFGSGSSRKTEILLQNLNAITHYVAIDISTDALAQAKERLQSRFPRLDVVTLAANIAEPVNLPDRLHEQPFLGFFPGSTIGNFEPTGAVDLLSTMRKTLGSDSHLIIGVDLKKDRETLHQAYNDSDGVTADFNLNVLRRANHELGANFDLSKFEHQARYNDRAGRIDMFLISQQQQRVDIDGQSFTFAPNESIHTEYSHKYAVSEFQALAANGGWKSDDVWTDPHQLFSVHVLKAS